VNHRIVSRETSVILLSLLFWCWLSFFFSHSFDEEEVDVVLTVVAVLAGVE